MSAGEYKSSSMDVESVRTDILKKLIVKSRLTEFELAQIVGVNESVVKDLKAAINRSTVASEKPLSWDYVLALKVGEEDDIRKPTKKELKARDEQLEKKNDNQSLKHQEWDNGMSRRKYNGQIFMDFYTRLENAKLTVRPFKSSDNKFMFLVVGITETNLKFWADQRDTDILIDPLGAVAEGRRRGFPLAVRTRLPNESEIDDGPMVNNNDNNDNKEEDEDKKVTNTLQGNNDCRDIPLSNWNFLYAEYNRGAVESVYKLYERIKGDPSLSTPFSEKTRLRIIFESIISDQGEGGAEIKIADWIHDKKHPLEAVFPLHDPLELRDFTNDWIRNCSIKQLIWCPLERVREYFGEPVAFYFGFLAFYLQWLIAPSIFGTIFLLVQLGMQIIDVPGLPLMCIFIIMWSVAFVDFWLRQESRYRLQWGMTKFQQKAVARPQFDGEWKHDSVDGTWKEEYSFFKRLRKMTVIFSGIIFMLGACIAAVINILLLRDDDPNNLLLKVGLGVANGVMIFVFDVLYKKFSGFGNEYENHRTEQDYQNALIVKSFLFRVFNAFSSLFFLAFVRPFYRGTAYYVKFYNNVCEQSNEIAPDAFRGKYSCTVDTCVDIVPTDEWTAVPAFADQNKDRFNDCSSINVDIQTNEAVLSELRIQLATLFLTAIFIQNTLEVGIPWLVEKIDEYKIKKKIEKGELTEEDAEKSEAEKQMKMAPYDNTIEDMTELIVQFGYVTLFVMALPCTPLLAFINNVIEMKVDATNLVMQSQRPHPNGSYGLGAWNDVLSFFSIVAVGTNVALITWRTQLVTEWFEDENQWKWIFFSIFSIILALIVALEKAIIPDVPEEVNQAIERQRLIESILVYGAAVDDVEEKPNSEDKDAGNSLSFDPTAELMEVDVLDPIPMDHLKYSDNPSALKLVKEAEGNDAYNDDNNQSTNKEEV